MKYFLILISKIIENTLSTIRIIVLSKNRKILGSILNIIISLVWILSIKITIHNLNKDYLKIIFFCLGAGLDSYIGSIIEEKIKK